MILKMFYCALVSCYFSCSRSSSTDCEIQNRCLQDISILEQFDSTGLFHWCQERTFDGVILVIITYKGRPKIGCLVHLSKLNIACFPTEGYMKLHCWLADPE